MPDDRKDARKRPGKEHDQEPWTWLPAESDTDKDKQKKH